MSGLQASPSRAFLTAAGPGNCVSRDQGPVPDTGKYFVNMKIFPSTSHQYEYPRLVFFSQVTRGIKRNIKEYHWWYYQRATTYYNDYYSTTPDRIIGLGCLYLTIPNTYNLIRININSNIIYYTIQMDQYHGYTPYTQRIWCSGNITANASKDIHFSKIPFSHSYGGGLI